MTSETSPGTSAGLGVVHPHMPPLPTLANRLYPSGWDSRTHAVPGRGLPPSQPEACTVRVMRSRSLMLLVLLVCGLAFVPSGVAKPRDGIPSWVAAPEKQTLARVFGNPAVVANWNIPYPRKIVVVWEFQWITVCRTCSAPSNAARPRGRVVRVSCEWSFIARGVVRRAAFQARQ